LKHALEYSPILTTHSPPTTIDGIIQNMTLETKAQEEKVQDAFQDLDALMVRAGEMVSDSFNKRAQL
jgi:hypothetical protein